MIFESFCKSALRHADKVAVVEGERTVTYGELLCRMAMVERHLAAEGVVSRSILFACCENSIEYVCFYFAAAKLGAIVVPVAPSLSTGEMQAIIDESKPLLLVTDDCLIDKMKELLLDCGRLINLDRVDMSSYSGEPGALLEGTRSMPDEDFVIHYTSGTTGRPKGVIQTQANHLSRIRNLSRTLDYDPSDSTLCILSLMHAYGSDVISWPALLTAQTLHLLRVRDADKSDVTGYIASKRITVFGGLPWHYQSYVDASAGPSVDLSHMKLAMVGATQLTPGLAEAFYRKFGKVLNNSYGLTETGCICTNLSDDLTSVYSIGKPLHGIDFEIRGEGNVGELLVASEGFAKAYTEGSGKELWVDGWIETGDLVKSKDGRLWALSRMEETFPVGDAFIYAFDLENHCASLAYLEESAAVNVDGECHLFVVPRKSKGKIEVNRVRSDLERLAPVYAGIAGTHIVTSFPKSVTGKISKAKLARAVREGCVSEAIDA